MRRAIAKVAAPLVLLLLGALLTAQAQEAGKVWRIGFLFAGTLAKRPQAEGFREGLKELGYVEGRNLIIQVREAGGRVDRLNHLAEELVALKPDVIVAVTTPAVAAAKRATREIPVVMLVVGDPVGAGLVTNLARPGGNITGLSNNNDELSAKRLQLLKELLPTATRIAVLWNEGNPQNRAVLERSLIAGRALGVSLLSLPIQGPDDLDKTLVPVSRERADAMVVVGDLLTFDLRASIISIAATNRLPTLFTYPEEATEGGLIAYGPNLREHYRRGAYYVDRLFKGAKPKDLPIEQPVRFDLLINLKTARALAVPIPPALLLRADRVIE